MIWRLRVAMLPALLGVLAAAPGAAHHSYTTYDMQKTVTLQGAIREVQWTNPHIWIQLVVKDTATGQEQEWSIEGASPNMLARSGWNRKSLHAGDLATIEVHPIKVGGKPFVGSVAGVTVNGKRVFGGKPGVTPVEEEK